MSKTLIKVRTVRSVEKFIKKVRKDSAGWPHVWFRGEGAGVETPLVPKLYRRQHNENKLLQTFRMRAPVVATLCPERKATDQWLFLAQHVGLPTRLLDWSESGLVGLHFALLKKKPVVWMLNPFALNAMSGASGDEFPLTWHRPQNGINIAFENIAGAWVLD